MAGRRRRPRRSALAAAGLVVALAACTAFNGGFLVAGPRCATLEVSTPQWRTPRRVTVSFGAGRCRA